MGDPVTAHDFVFSWRRIVEPALACEYATGCIWWRTGVKRGPFPRRIDDLIKLACGPCDDRTFEVTLVAPTADFLQIILHHAFLPVHLPSTIERFRRDRCARFPGGHSGVFRGNVLSINRNGGEYSDFGGNGIHNYWDADNVRLDGIRFFPIDDENTEGNRAFRTGQLHITSSVPANMRERYQRDHPQYIRFDHQAAVYFLSP